MYNIGLLLVLLLAVCMLWPKNKGLLQSGAPAPHFTLTNESGSQVSLPQSGKVALVFFPKAHALSFGCKKQVCSLRDDFAELKAKGIQLLGLTGSSVESIKEFKGSNRLPFTVLHATPEVLQAYAVDGWFGAKRHTILIDNGQIVGVITKVDLSNHPEQILKGFNL